MGSTAACCRPWQLHRLEVGQGKCDVAQLPGAKRPEPQALMGPVQQRKQQQLALLLLVVLLLLMLPLQLCQRPDHNSDGAWGHAADVCRQVLQQRIKQLLLPVLLRWLLLLLTLLLLLARCAGRLLLLQQPGEKDGVVYGVQPVPVLCMQLQQLYSAACLLNLPVEAGSVSRGRRSEGVRNGAAQQTPPLLLSLLCRAAE